MAAIAVSDPGLSTTTLVSTDERMSSAERPTISESRSEEYRHRLADINARACVDDPLNRLFQYEKTGDTQPITAELLYRASRERVDVKTAAGAIIVEAAGFAAVACWEPPVVTEQSPSYTDEAIDGLAQTRPVFAAFLRQVVSARRKCLGDDQKYWLLSLMARDPGRKDKGAVRAVLEPYIARAKADGLPIWLIAGNERARDVYAYFGFGVVSVNESTLRDGSQKVHTYNMVCNWPIK